MNNRLPPFPEQNLNAWARKLYEYLVANSPAKGTVDPTPILLPHIPANQTPRATTPGVLMYDQTAGQVVVSDGSAFVAIGGGGGPVTLAGDVTGPSGSNTLATVNSNVGSFGLAASVAQFTVNAKGLITAAANVAISIASTAISDSTAAGRAMLTAATAAAQTALLDVFTSGAKGLVPASGGGTTNFLRADGTFAAPSSSVTLAGDVTGPSGSNTLATVNSNVGSFGLAASVAQFTVNAKGLITAAANVAISIASTAIGDSTAAGRAMLTAATVAAQTALLDVFTSGAKGLVPASGGGTTNFLRADGTFAAPAGGSSATDSLIRLAAPYNLANSAAVQKLFNTSTNGEVTLDTGQYVFECMIYLTGMSGTSGNAQFVLAAGTATILNAAVSVYGRDASAAAQPGALNGSTSINAANTPGGSMFTAATATELIATITGRFDISVAGTLIPSIDLANAIASVNVAQGSYFHCRRIGDTGDDTVGTWS